MTPEQRNTLARLRSNLRQLIVDVRTSRDQAPPGAKAAFRYPGDFLENAATELDCAAAKRGAFDHD